MSETTRDAEGVAGARAAPTRSTWASRRARHRAATIAGGGSLLVVGTVLLFLPGPGLLVMLAGLAVLGREVAWARRLRARMLSTLRRRRAERDAVLVRHGPE